MRKLLSSRKSSRKLELLRMKVNFVFYIKIVDEIFGILISEKLYLQVIPHKKTQRVT